MYQKMMEVFFRFHRLKIYRILPEIFKSDFSLLAKLMCVRDNQEGGQGIMVSELAKKIEVSVPSVSRTLKHLENKGYVRRYEDKKDRRITYVCLTEQGNGILQEVDTVMKDYWETVISKMKPSTVELLMDAIDEFYAVAEEELEKRLKKTGERMGVRETDI